MRALPVALMIHDNSTDRTTIVPATHHSNFCPINFRCFLEGLWPLRPRKFEAITVSASHQLALTTSLPFVHTARRSYRLNGPVKCSDRGDVGGSLPATSREVH
ncbi:hypothetical protein V6N13_030597 [Hibiscus sabdariffa]